MVSASSVAASSSTVSVFDSATTGVSSVAASSPTVSVFDSATTGVSSIASALTSDDTAVSTSGISASVALASATKALSAESLNVPSGTV